MERRASRKLVRARSWVEWRLGFPRKYPDLELFGSLDKFGLNAVVGLGTGFRYGGRGVDRRLASFEQPTAREPLTARQANTLYRMLKDIGAEEDVPAGNMSNPSNCAEGKLTYRDGLIGSRRETHNRRARMARRGRGSEPIPGRDARPGPRSRCSSARCTS